ncbi:MAG: bifunctional phosphopantothenoylcysteine decarboxylase/phosphopantothenate--cysteine ligase CoaBC [Candidatus Methanoplasma sp.]|jgi:phosphopantothenoylcysteine decarboxylase/phosphopantothenate--cysteine ligase|nr:bifunctional phosphopantothenoylcysteine decarboxylase/phosphopantothenate--cysteine ligase CoaBC [Candidatus Methanoplasma sp.]
MHPSEEIYCEKSGRLRGKTIVIGITGSIAATECFSVIRDLVRNGAKVIPVMTPAAARLASPDAIEFASGTRPIIELTGQTEHVKHLGGKNAADLFMIYPATANTISKIAMGIDDTSVTSMSTVAIGGGIPVAVVPAMHGAMMKNPAVSENIEKLRRMGVHVIGPHSDGVREKVASREEAVAWAVKLLSRNNLAGKRILVIGGRSEEPLDSMRLVTNRSTGLMTVMLAQRAFERGADVELWMGGSSVPLPDYIPTRRYASVSDLVEMLDSIDHDIVIVPAALADFTPAERFEGKMPSGTPHTVLLNPVPKVLPMICKRCGSVIGFKAESGLAHSELVDKARGRLLEYGLTAVVANDIDDAGRETSAAVLVTKDDAKNITGSKADVSDEILNFCAETI